MTSRTFPGIGAPTWPLMDFWALGWNFISWKEQMIVFISPSCLLLKPWLSCEQIQHVYHWIHVWGSAGHLSVWRPVESPCTFMATVSLTRTDRSWPFSSKKTSLWPALFRSPRARALMWRIFPRSSSTCSHTPTGQEDRNTFKNNPYTGTQLDYGGELELIGGAKVHSSNKNAVGARRAETVVFV